MIPVVRIIAGIFTALGIGLIAFGLFAQSRLVPGAAPDAPRPQALQPPPHQPVPPPSAAPVQRAEDAQPAPQIAAPTTQAADAALPGNPAAEMPPTAAQSPIGGPYVPLPQPAPQPDRISALPPSLDQTAAPPAASKNTRTEPLVARHKKPKKTQKFTNPLRALFGR